MDYIPNPWMVLPFVFLLALIALAPLFFAEWWGRHYPKVAFGLAAITLTYYLGFLPKEAAHTALHTGIEYVSFIALIGSLFVVSGGIHINVKGEATPHVNAIFLLLGAVLANFLGTTGASMLMIRPWLRMNRYRVTTHHVVFFIFIVSNVGGCLTPIGDPPLFLGYLKGVPFWWVMEACLPMWAVGVGLLVAMFYVVDRRNYLKAPRQVRAELAEPPDRWRFDGLGNIFFLAVILVAVFIQKPFLLREGLMIAAAVGSYFTTRKEVHAANHFNFHPIKEVAILFIGIFATMMPALDWLRSHGDQLAKASPGFFYWGSGTLSSVLDNAPTYLSFLNASFGAFIEPHVPATMQTALIHGTVTDPSLPETIRSALQTLLKYHSSAASNADIDPDILRVSYLIGQPNLVRFLIAISVGAVFFGANTYIGNGPNFMVKAIADHQKVRTPTFLGYIFKFSLPFMLPMLLVVWLLFFRN